MDNYLDKTRFNSYYLLQANNAAHYLRMTARRLSSQHLKNLISHIKARNRCGITWPEGTAPTFHEQRSLSERLYREQGLETQKLLGHKSQKMTDKYNDDRGKEWIVIAV